MQRRRLVITVLAILAIVGIVVILRGTSGGRTLVMITGLPGGTTHTIATLLEPELAQQGFPLDIRPESKGRSVADQVAAGLQSADMAVVVGTFDWGATMGDGDQAGASGYNALTSVGTVMTIPIVFAARSTLRDVENLSDLRGRTIGIRSACVCEPVILTSLAAYGVTPANSRFKILGTDELAEGIANGSLDALATTVPPGQSFIAPSLEDGTLRVVDIPETEAIARRAREVVPTNVPRGTFRIHPPLPADDVSTPGLLVTIVTRADLNEAAVLAIAVAVERVFATGTEFSSSGEYPNFQDPMLTPNPTASAFYDTGAIPWQFRYLPDRVAEAIIPLLLALTLFLLVASVYAAFFPEVYSLWTGVLQPRVHERRVRRSEHRAASGEPLSDRQRRHLQRIVDAHATDQLREERARALLDDAAQTPPGGE